MRVTCCGAIANAISLLKLLLFNTVILQYKTPQFSLDSNNETPLPRHLKEVKILALIPKQATTNTQYRLNASPYFLNIQYQRENRG